MATTEPPSSPGNPHAHVGAVTSAVAVDETATEEALVAAPEVMADNLSDYVNAWWRRVRAGESGVLPVILALAVIIVVFEVQTSLFLSAKNIVNLLNQTVVFTLFAIGEIFVLLLGELDLSVVYNAGIGAGVMAAMVAPPYNLPWWLAIIMGLALTTAIGLIQGFLITRLRLPAFIVTLAGFIGLEGVMIWMFDSFSVAVGGVVSVSNHVILDLVGYSMSPGWSWVAMAVFVVLYGGYSIFRDSRRRASGLVTPPMGLTVTKALTVAVAGVLLVAVCNINRGTIYRAVRGVPWSIPVVLVIFGLASILLFRTRFGRYIYAIGGNTEAARRAGINVFLVRNIAFGLSGLMAGLAGLMYLSQQGSIATDIDPSYALYAIAAAVIGGTSLFGGRGKPLHAILGALVIGAVYNGIDLVGASAAATDIVTAIVLIIAVTVDSLTRRNVRAH